MISQQTCGLDENTQNKIIHVLMKHKDIEKAVLYGSRAKGNYKPGSDIDLTLFAPDMSLSDMLKVENEIDDLFLVYKMDLSLFHQIDNPALLEHIQRVGQVFYSRI
ncbi:MAG: nucleotidyltransferase domain-containing protein [Pseudobdellovibrio sp.]|nr:nucleotidyltransferase domain-containing protein [Pseudobdellovibrio sp.]